MWVSQSSNKVEYAGEAPDLGAYETDFLLKNATLPVELKSISNTDELAIHALNHEKSDPISIKRKHGGMLIISLKDANARDRYTLNIYSADGKCLSSRQFQKTTTFNTQGMKGTYFIRVEGNGLSQGISIGI